MTGNREDASTILAVALGVGFLVFLIMACAGTDVGPAPSCVSSAYNPTCPER